MRRGCVWPIIPCMPRPASRQSFGSCVVLPLPVSPQTTITRWRVSASRMVSRACETGSSSGYSSRTRVARRFSARDSASIRRASSFSTSRDAGRPLLSRFSMAPSSARRSVRSSRATFSMRAFRSKFGSLILLPCRGTSNGGDRPAERHAHVGAAERRAADLERPAVKLDGLAHDRKTDALPGHRLVGAHPALEHALRLVRLETVTVVADREDDTIRPRIDPHRHAALAVLISIVEQIAEQLREIPGIAVEHRARLDVERAVDGLVAIYLIERLFQIRYDRRDGDRLDAEPGRTARARPSQLIGDALIHSLDLAREGLLHPFARSAADRELG